MENVSKIVRKTAQINLDKYSEKMHKKTQRFKPM